MGKKHGKSAYTSGEVEFERDWYIGRFQGKLISYSNNILFLIERGMLEITSMVYNGTE